MYDIILRNGLLVNDDGAVRRDLAVADGKIALLAESVDAEAALVLDAGGQPVLPGGVDPHTHFDLQAGYCRTVDDFSYGSLAALCGGATSIVDHPAFGPPGCGLSHQIEAYHQLAAGRCYIDYGFHGVVQHWDEQVSQDMAWLKEAGISSVKAYMTYDFRLDDQALQALFQRARELDMLVTVHAEDHEAIQALREMYAAAGLLSPYYHALSRPNGCEARAVARALHAAHLAGDAPVYIVHLSTAEGLAEIREARARGQANIFAETCPQYLLLDSSRYLLPQPEGLKYIMCPPLRSPADNAALWQGLASGDIQTVGTDHCSFSLAKQKLAGVADFRLTPSGAPGVEERLALLYTYGVAAGRFPLQRLAAVTAANPARLFGLWPRKGRLAEGADADLVLLDTTARGTLHQETLHSACDYSAYEGMKLSCAVKSVIQGGRLAYHEGRVLGSPGQGQFLSRHTEEGNWAGLS